MSVNRGQYDRFERLRQRAEELIQKNPEAEHEKDSEFTELIHELEIHQAELELQNEEFKRSQQEINALHQKYESLYEFAPCGYITLDASGTIQQINLTGAAILGINRNSFTAHTSFSNYVAQEWKDAFRELLIDLGKNNEKKSAELKLEDKDGDPNWIRADIQPVQADIQPVQNVKDPVVQWQMTITDINERKQAEKQLKRIEWMLQPEKEHKNCFTPEYGNLLDLNSSRVILDSVGEEVLTNIVKDFLNLLGTSVAVFEANGDYALSILSSKWCRFMDQSSRRLCNTDDNREALTCGKWLCHESCWRAAKECMETAKPVDKECEGGIRLYAVPIHSEGKVIGSINLGYYDPPQDLSTLNKLAAKYNVSAQELFQYANAYESRPLFIVENAKSRMDRVAWLIGEIVERKHAEENLRRSEKYYRTIFETSGTTKEVIEEDTTISHMNSNFTVQSGYSQYEIEVEKSLTDFVHPDDLDILESLNELVITVDLEYQFNYVNQAYCEIFDKTREELLGQPFLPLVHGEDIDDTLNSMESLYTPPYRNYVEQWAMTVNGWRWIAWEYNGILDENGEVVEILAEGRDITERKLAEEALRRSEEYYRTIFETSASAMFIIEEDTTISHVNSKFLALFGYSRQEIEGKKSWTEFVHPDDVEWLQEIYYEQRENPDFVSRLYEFRGITHNSEELNILAFVDMIPETNRSIAFGVDITGRKQLEEEFKDYPQESAPPEDNTSDQTDARREVTADVTTENKEVFQEAELFALSGDDLNLIQALLEEVLMALPNRLHDLKKAAENGNAQDINFYAHSIKGMSRIISAHRIMETAYNLETLGTNQDLSGVKELISELEIEFELLKTAVTKRLFDYL